MTACLILKAVFVDIRVGLGVTAGLRGENRLGVGVGVTAGLIFRATFLTTIYSMFVG